MLSDQPVDIVVIGRALEAAKAEQTLTVQLIDETQLRAAPSLALEQVLQQAAGLQLFRRSDARSANPTSQGVTLRALGGNAASRALLVLDGVPQTDPFGGWVNWPAFDPLSLEQVRVTRGGGSVADGPGALAGTIELESSVKPGTLADVSVGSRGSVEGHLIANERLGGGVAGLSVHAGRGDGFVPVTSDTRGIADRRASYGNAAGTLRWAGPVTRAVELQGSLSGFIDDRSRGLRFSDNRTRGAGASVRLVGSGRWQWSATGYLQRRAFESSFATTDAGRTTARRTSLQYHVPGRGLGWSAELRPPLGAQVEVRLGTDGRFMRGQSDELGTYLDEVAARDRSSGGKVAHAGAFAEASWSRGPVLLTGGARLDRLRIADGFFRERVIASGALSQEQRYRARSEWLPTVRSGVRVALGSGIGVRGAAYLGWRPPTINELFRPFRLGPDATAANPQLQPERLSGAEAGVDWLRRRTRLQLTAFRNRMADPIVNVSLGRGPGTFPTVGFVPAGGLFRQRRNLAAIDVAGLEGGVTWSRGAWSLAGNASWTRARVRGGGAGRNLTGLRPAQTPAFAAAASTSWSGKSAAATLQLRYVGAQFEDDLNRLRLPSALTVDGSLQLPLAKRLQLVARAENLLDAEVVAARTSDGTTERATPRTLWLGLRLTRRP